MAEKNWVAFTIYNEITDVTRCLSAHKRWYNNSCRDESFLLAGEVMESMVYLKDFSTTKEAKLFCDAWEML